jgi:hypothetical protein
MVKTLLVTGKTRSRRSSLQPRGFHRVAGIPAQNRITLLREAL